MKMSLTTVMAILILPVLTGFAEADPFDLRGIKLGLTLSEFRTLPHPDAKEQGYKTKVICTNDQEASTVYDLYIGEDDKKSGLKVCNFYGLHESYPGSPLPPDWQQETMIVAGVATYMEYGFVPDPKQPSEFRLYRIGVRSNAEYWDQFWKGYTEKYGKPTAIDDSPVQNGVGNTFDNIIAVWTRTDSSITLIKRYTKITDTRIFYQHTKLSEEVDRRREAVTGKSSSTL